MSHLVPTVQHMILRELEAFKREIAAYPTDDSPWVVVPGVANTGGNLALHCAGNLQHFIGARLGSTGYVRHRDVEFASRGATRAELIAELDRAAAAVRSTLSALGDDSIPVKYPDAFGGKSVNTDAMLVHLAVHLSYHLGQVDYHRRITTGDGTTLDAVDAKQLPELRPE